MTESPFIGLLRLILKWLMKLFLHLKGFKTVNGAKLPTTQQSYIVIANHAAFIDSIYMICSLKPRLTICGAKPKYFSTPFKRFIMRLGGIIKVDTPAQLIKDCVAFLANNQVILIYPEMGRNKAELGKFKTYAAEVSNKSSIPVIPCYIYSTTVGQSGAPRVIVGDPIPPISDAVELTDQYRRAILELKASLNGVAS